MKNNQQSKVLTILLVFLFVVFFTGLIGRGITPRVITDFLIVRPLQWSALNIRKVGSSLVDFSNYMSSKQLLTEENDRLKIENSSLQERLKILQSYYNENVDLKASLGIQNQGNYKLSEVNVLWYNYASNTMVISGGFKQGIKKNMPVVISLDGKTTNLVGLISETSYNSSTVLLGTSPYFKIGVKNIIRGGFDVAQGSGNSLLITSYQISLEVDTGDLYVSSGFGDIFPEGIVVGRVISVNNQKGIKREIKLEPIVNYATLLRVIVVTGNE